MPDPDTPPGSSHRIPTSDDIEVSTYLEIARRQTAIDGVEQKLATGRAFVKPEMVVILDFGSQYSMLIARRVRECNVYCELLPYDAPWERIAELKPLGFILSGGPASVYEDDAPRAPSYVFESGLPVLGICYGMQLIADQLGGRVIASERREYGQATVFQGDEESPLLAGLPPSMPVWMSHGDQVVDLPPGFDRSPIPITLLLP